MEARMKKQKSRSQCAYFGIRTVQSRDHVVPKALFGKPTPQNVVTVGACMECNQAKSPCDDYHRDCLACDVRVSTNPIAKALKAGAIGRSVETNRSILSRQAVRHGRLTPMLTPRGLYVGRCVSVRVSADRIAGALWFMVRGLYHHLTKTMLPDTYVYAICPVHSEHCDTTFDEFWKSGTPDVVAIGESVFEAKYNIWSEDHFTTNWCLRFYGRIVYCVYVASSANAQQHLIPTLGAAASPASPVGLPVIITPESLGM